jgi:type VI secretion system protein ImpE
MPTAQELYEAGRLGEAIEALGVELRAHPADVRRRTFLFELLTFAGDWTRAERQLDALSREGPEADVGTRLYRSAVVAERVREHMFDVGDLPSGVAPGPVGGELNGVPFRSMADADPRIGARLEVCAGGRYLWIPFAHLASVTAAAPANLRDLRWLPARVRMAPDVRDLELGEVLLPTLTPAAWRHADDAIRLGRVADWEDAEDEAYRPVGQKLLVVDDRYVPLLEIRELTLLP